MVRATERMVEIVHQGIRVASHPRALGINRSETVPDHRPPAHRAYLEWTPERVLRWAEDIDPAATDLIQRRLTMRAPRAELSGLSRDLRTGETLWA